LKYIVKATWSEIVATMGDPMIVACYSHMKLYTGLYEYYSTWLRDKKLVIEQT
jgi:hypothetical protein